MKTPRLTATALSFCVMSCALVCRCLTAAELPKAPPAPHPDDRFKADILVVVAHPDDETEITGYLAKAVYEEHRRVAVIFGTRGDGGGNAMGYEQAAALGAEREIEGRRALASFGIMNVWFLGGPDTPGQDVLRSLETWNHGAALAQAVRLVRLTRPEVILTWLPVYVAGENHGDHQAAGVIATEAFDLAGDATVFPEQIAAPRERQGISNLTEGLHPWQPKKLYYFSDASHTDFLEGKGPRYSTMGVSPSRGVPYYRLAADEMSFHLTQDDTGQLAKQAIAKGDFKYFEEPVFLVLGKSHVRSTITGDIFEGIQRDLIPFVPAHGYQPAQDAGIAVELGGPWTFYREFWKAHGLDQLAGLLATPEAGLAPGERLHLPVLLHNGTAEARDVTLTAVVPSGWTVAAGQAVFPVDAHATYPVETVLASPSKGDPAWQTVVWKAESGGKTIGSISMRVNFTGGGLPQ
jgi:LmbE family N-acetylglucosaminyl deacetylase